MENESQQQEAENLEEQGPARVQFLIELDENDDVHVSGPLIPPALVVGILDLAKFKVQSGYFVQVAQAVARENVMNPAKRIELPRGSLPIKKR
jgi:hypothetical protein